MALTEIILCKTIYIIKKQVSLVGSQVCCVIDFEQTRTLEGTKNVLRIKGTLIHVILCT